MNKNYWKSLTAIFMFTILLVGCGSDSIDEDAQEQENDGNTENVVEELRVAMNASPPTLDQLIDPTIVTRDAARLIFETLFTVDSDFQPVPLLAESVETDEENRVYTFHLREGVKFHNGKEMTAEDVVASMNRWMEVSTVTGVVFEDAEFRIEDDYTVVLELAQPSTLVLDLIASTKQSPNIMPKEVVETTDADGLNEYIGTGPYQFEEWRIDQYIHFVKNDDYEPVEGEPDGLAGKKEALAENIYFDIVTDASTRLAGIQSGEYDIIYQVPRDDYELVQDDENLQTYVDAYGELFYFYNVNEGLASDVEIRKAINTALDMESIMRAAYSNEDLYWLDSGYMHRNIVNWASDAGSEYYNQNDVETAKELLDQAGYNGEEFRILTTRDYPEFYNASIVIQERLTEIGMNINLEVYDWPTFNEMLQDPSNWDTLVSGTAIVSTPSQLLTISPTFLGGMADDKIIELLGAIDTSPDQDEAKQLWDELQLYAWEEYLPASTLGGSYDVYASTNEVQGFTLFSGPVLWNTTLESE